MLANSEALIPQAMTAIESIMRRQHRLQTGKDDDFDIRSQSDFLNAAQQTMQLFGLLLAGIATVSLLVGGIGGS